MDECKPLLLGTLKPGGRRGDEQVLYVDEGDDTREGKEAGAHTRPLFSST